MAISNCVDVFLLAHLRAGHTPLLKAYANPLDPSADPLCPVYKEDPPTIENRLLRCPRLDVTRQSIFESLSPSLDPERVLAFARATLG